MSAFDYQKWLRIFDYKNIEGFLRSEKGKGTKGDAMGRVAVSQFIYDIPSSLISLLNMIVGGAAVSAIAGATLTGGLGVAALAVSVVVDIVMVVLVLLATNWTQHMIAGMLGGKGKYEDLLHLDSLSIAAMNLASIIGLIPEAISVFPGAGKTIGGAMSCILLPFYLVIGAYALYVNYLTVKINYGLESGRAAGAVVLNIIVWLVIIIVVVLVLAATIGAAVLSGLGGLGALPNL
jgi:hypothetical protein